MQIENDLDLDIINQKKKLDSQKKKLLLKEKILKEKEKKKEISKFLEVGRLAKLASILHLEESVLLGAFIEIANKSQDLQQIDKWKKSSSSILNGQKSDLSSKVIAISFKKDPSLQIKESLKNLNFKWNKFRKEFYGSANLETVKILLGTVEYQIDEISL